MKKLIYTLCLMIATPVLAQDIAKVTEKLGETVGGDAKRFFSDVYASGNEAVKADLLAIGTKINSIEDVTVVRTKNAWKDYVNIDQAVESYNKEYKGSLDAKGMEGVLIKRAVEDRKIKGTEQVQFRGLKSFSKEKSNALLTLMELQSRENFMGIQYREQEFFGIVRTKLGLPAFDADLCGRVLGLDKCAVAKPQEALPTGEL